jgi:hypothetical protein
MVRRWRQRVAQRGLIYLHVTLSRATAFEPARITGGLA